MNRVRSIGAAVVLAAIVILTPVALWVWGVPPGRVTNLLRPDDGSALLAVLTLLGWLVWAAFTASVLIEGINVVGRRAVPLRLPLLGGLQSVAGALVFAALAPAASAAAVPVHSTTPDQSVAGAQLADEVAAAGDAAGDDTVELDESYLVQPGDDLWSVAEQLLGEGRRWRDLAEANPELLAAPTVDLIPGTRLLLPAEAVQTAHRQATKSRTITVVRGDTLSGLAKKHLGDAARWPRIYHANADRIDDPDLIDVGWKLVIPFRASAKKAVPAQSRPPRRPVATVESTAPRITRPEPQTAQPQETSRTAAPAPSPDGGAGSAAPAGDPTWPLVGGLGAATAAMILTTLGVNRLAQLRSRPLGRRISQPPVDVRRYETALGRRERPDSTALLERALRHLGAHAHATGHPLPALDRVVLDDVGATFRWRRPPVTEPPAGFHQLGQDWSLSVSAAAELPHSTHPVPFPALVTLGRDPNGSWLMIDLEARSPFGLSGSRALRHATVAAMAVELSCAPWSAELNLTVVGGDEMFIRAACPELVRFDADPGIALQALQALVEERGEDEAPTALLRVDPDRAEAGAAQVTLFADDLEPELRSRLDGLLDADLGVSAVVTGVAESALVLSGAEDDASATLEPDALAVRPQLIPTHTRAAIGTIFAATDESAHNPAPWWSDQSADNVRTLVPRRASERIQINEDEPDLPGHPYLQLLGPIVLSGAAGPAPSRSRRQCEEYCAWLLENPRSTATQMVNELVVAETTRRSNMSRLRSWLGTDPDGRPYLPEAYSGRIELHPEVGSDWQRLQLLVAPGLNRLTPETLVSVLELVRGAPLADAAPGQWRWAEELRTDMASMARDAGVVLTRWAVEHGDIDLARWAAARALLAAPEDELLLVERIATEHLAGNTAEVQRLVRWVTGQARALGVDLAPETIDACQRAMEGRTRPRVLP